MLTVTDQPARTVSRARSTRRGSSGSRCCWPAPSRSSGSASCPGRGLGNPGIQPRPAHPADFALSFPARDAPHADRPHRSCATARRGFRAGRGASGGAGRQPDADPRYRHLRLHHLGRRRGADDLRLGARQEAPAGRGASDLHAAPAAFHLSQADHRAADDFLGDRRLVRRADGRAGLSRRQRDRSRASTSCRSPRPARGCAISFRSSAFPISSRSSIAGRYGTRRCFCWPPCR